MTHQSQFSGGEGLLPTARVVGSANVRLDLIGFFGGSGLRMGLDNPTVAHGCPKNTKKNPFFPFKKKYLFKKKIIKLIHYALELLCVYNAPILTILV